MAGQIRISPDQMDQRANQYTQQANTVQDVISTMVSLLNQLQSEWEGSAAEAYAEKWEQLKPSFVAAKNLIDDIATSLHSTATSLRDTDANIASQFKK